MKTYPILRPDGSLLAFEISSSWLTFRPIYRILRSVHGVADIKRNWFNEDRISFTYHGFPCVINEPWADNSRYWIGPVDTKVGINLAPLNEAFQQYRSLLTMDVVFRR